MTVTYTKLRSGEWGLRGEEITKGCEGCATTYDKGDVPHGNQVELHLEAMAYLKLLDAMKEGEPLIRQRLEAEMARRKRYLDALGGNGASQAPGRHQR